MKRLLFILLAITIGCEEYPPITTYIPPPTVYEKMVGQWEFTYCERIIIDSSITTDFYYNCELFDVMYYWTKNNMIIYIGQKWVHSDYFLFNIEIKLINDTILSVSGKYTREFHNGNVWHIDYERTYYKQ